MRILHCSATKCCGCSSFINTHFVPSVFLATLQTHIRRRAKDCLKCLGAQLSETSRCHLTNMRAREHSRVCKLLIYASQRSLQLSIFHRCHIARQLFSLFCPVFFNSAPLFYDECKKNFSHSIERGKQILSMWGVVSQRRKIKNTFIFIRDLRFGWCAGSKCFLLASHLSKSSPPSSAKRWDILFSCFMPVCKLSTKSTQQIKWKRRRRRNKHSLLFDNFQEALKYWSAWKQIATLADANKLLETVANSSTSPFQHVYFTRFLCLLLQRK